MGSTKSPSVELLAGQAPPRVRHAPKVRANSWEDVADLSATLGVELDQWQETALEAAMGERADGRWAARLVGVSAPRQQGKSQLIVARALAGVMLFAERHVIISAHQADTAREVWVRLLDLVEANPSLESRVDSIMRSINRESITFRIDGQTSTIKMKARSLSGGRGFSADCLLLDEAQILGRAAWSSILPTMSARENPQAWLLGTPPGPVDDGEVFTSLRGQGLAGRGQVAWVEWAANPGDDIDSPATWAAANPALGHRITAEAIEAERAVMTDDQFRLERLGMWHLAGADSVIPMQGWAKQADGGSTVEHGHALGVEVGPDMGWASVALAGFRADDARHIELVHDQNTMGRGVAWLAPALQRIVADNPQVRAVVADIAGPIRPLLLERSGRYWLRQGDDVSRGVEVVPLKVAQLGAGCADLLSGVTVGNVWHIDQPQLTAAAGAATKRPLGDTGMWTWSRRAADSDITPIQAATYALVGTRLERPRRPGAGVPRSSSASRVSRQYVTR